MYYTKINRKPNRNASLKILIFIGLCVILGAVNCGCGSSSVCAKLDLPECPDYSSELCGCFDLVKMRGGFAGGDHDPHDNDLYEAIVLRPDSTFELYRDDTLSWRASIRRIGRPTPDGEISDELLLFNKDGEELNLGVTFKDPDHLWCGPKNEVDAFCFMYIRYR